jgi:cobalt/nickel transport system permease protein
MTDGPRTHLSTGSTTKRAASLSGWGTAWVLGIGLILAVASPAYAMHIAEQILPAPWAGLWFLVALPAVYWGLRQIRRRGERDPRYKALVGLVGSAVFLISCMPIPVPWTGTCAHPCGTGLAAVLIGPGPTIVVASIALLFQALFLAHGGLTTLGGNIVSLGVAGAFSGYLIFVVVRRVSGSALAAAFAAGLLSDWITYAMTSLQLATALHGEGSVLSMFLAVLIAFAPTQVPLGIAEGFVSMAAYGFIRNRRPELLSSLSPGRNA